MKIEDLKKMSAGGRIQLNELPQEFIGVLVNERTVVDDRGRQLIYWDIQVEGEKSGKLTQKFSPLHFDDLAEALTKLGITDTSQAIGKKFKFRQKIFRSGYPRWLPIELL